MSNIFLVCFSLSTSLTFLCMNNSGTCTCMVGFTGGACERLACPTSEGNGCSGNGKCVNLEEAAAQRETNGIVAATTYGKVYIYLFILYSLIHFSLTDTQIRVETWWRLGGQTENC